MTIRIGISGWRYPPWRKVFYPAGWPQRRELEFAAQQFPTIEINGSFYSLQRPEYYAQWVEQTPEGFVFAVKGSRFITHMKKLRQVETALANFFASGVLALGDRLGPFLWQFAANMPCELERFDAFFSMLPRDTGAAARLARGHEPWMAGRSLVQADDERPLRHAVEVRNASCMTPEWFALLRKHQIAWVIADTAGRWPYAEDLTSDFVYLRLHGDKKLYESGYGSRAIARWAERIDAWRQGEQLPGATCVTEPLRPAQQRELDVYVYFDNDVKVHAPFDALALHRALDLPPWREDAPSLPERRPRLHRQETSRPRAPTIERSAGDEAGRRERSTR